MYARIRIYGMCSLTIECVLVLWNVFSYCKMRAFMAGGRGGQGRAALQALRRHVRRQEVRDARPLDERHQRRFPRRQPPRYAGLSLTLTYGLSLTLRALAYIAFALRRIFGRW